MSVEGKATMLRLAKAMSVLQANLPRLGASRSGRIDPSRLPNLDLAGGLANPLNGLARALDPRKMQEAARRTAGTMAHARSKLGAEDLFPAGHVRAQAPLQPGARFEDCAFSNQAGSRAYKLFVPSGYAGQAVPLIVMLHGCTQSPDDFAAGTQMNELAEEQTFLVAYPAQTQSANSSKCWNWFRTSDQQRDRGEPSLIAGITRDIMRTYSVDPRSVFVAGLSAGGAAAAVLGAAYPDLFAAVGVHSGLACGAARDIPSAFAAMQGGGTPHSSEDQKPIRTIVFHGDRDKTVHPINGDQVIAQSRANSSPRSSVTSGQSAGGLNYTRTVAVDEDGHSLMEHWVLHGAGHAWSGGSPLGSYTDPRGPDASREMVRFFLDLPKNTLPRPL